MNQTDGWDLVFNAGWHTDSNGNAKLWTNADLDKIVATFDPAFHEPPLVIGHPADNAPAFGWVEGIKRVGSDLYLKYKDVAVEFTDLAKRKLFKKKSIAVYPDGRLRHIGYLGAMPPAIKGLPDFQFADADKGAAITYEFCDWKMTTLGRIVMKIRDYLVEKEGADKADNIISSWDVQDLITPQVEEAQPISSYHEEEQMDPKEVQVLIDQALAKQETKFSEQLKGIADSIKGISTQFNELQTGQAAIAKANQEREFAEFLLTPAMLRRIPEAQRTATVTHLMSLTAAPAIEFGEGDGKKTVSAVDCYKEQLAKLPEVVEFSELATHDRVGDVSTAGMDASTLASKAVQFQESEAAAGRSISMTAAVNHVKKEGK